MGSFEDSVKLLQRECVCMCFHVCVPAVCIHVSVCLYVCVMPITLVTLTTVIPCHYPPTQQARVIALPIL